MHNFTFFRYAIYLVLLRAAFTSAEHTSTRTDKREVDQVCNEWSTSADAWAQANVDAILLAVLANASATGQRFDHTFGKAINYLDFECGIGKEATCAVGPCTDFQNATEYLAAIAIQNMNVMFNVLYSGIALAQPDAADLANDLADRFFHWKDPFYLGTAIAYAVDAAVTAVCTFGLGAPSVAEELPKTVGGIVGVQEVSKGTGGVVAQYLQPSPGETRNSGLRDLDDMYYNYSSTAAAALDHLANDIFSGKSDLYNSSILDYLANGYFLDADIIPSQTDVRDFYKTTLIARTINALYRTAPVYLVSTTAPQISLPGSLQNSSWTNSSTGRTFILYGYQGGIVQPPPNINVLNGSLYNITASQIAQAAGRAWEVAGNNYTDEISKEQILDSFDSQGALTPFQDQAGWEGMSTIPVCDIGNRAEWVATYGKRTVPCCCGYNCEDTHTFIRLANLNKTEDWYYQCESQLKGTSLDFADINYGIDLGSRAHQFWHNLGHAGRIGFTVGIVIAFLACSFVSLVVLLVIIGALIDP